RALEVELAREWEPAVGLVIDGRLRRP
ncbi:MAG: hypothetical protein K0R44_1658, partial [Thermomicrobiales bacterium]|nr:hypothetical protein [Thermomicrobiales bacterium]